MTVRKPTLDEWFLAYQLRFMWREGFFNPAFLDVDVTSLLEHYGAANKRISYTALVMKALALTAREVPELNRAYARTPFGDRVIEFDHISVSLPVALRENGQSYLTAITVRDADRTPLASITEQIDAAKLRTIDQTKLTKIVARKSNNLWWRTVLRVIHFGVYRWPGMAAVGAGGLAVSSVIEHRDNPSQLHVATLGPTAVTVLISGVRHTAEGRSILELGLGLNHIAMSGIAFRRMTTVFNDLLSGRDPGRLAAFD